MNNDQHKAGFLAYKVGADLSRETLARLAQIKSGGTIAELADVLGISELAEHMAAGFLAGVFPGVFESKDKAEYQTHFKPLAHLFEAYLKAAPFAALLKNSYNNHSKN